MSYFFPYCPHSLGWALFSWLEGGHPSVFLPISSTCYSIIPRSPVGTIAQLDHDSNSKDYKLSGFHFWSKTTADTTNWACPSVKTHTHIPGVLCWHILFSQKDLRDALICNIHHKCKVHWCYKCLFSQKQCTKFKMAAKMGASRDFPGGRHKSGVLHLHSLLLLLLFPCGDGLHQFTTAESQ